MAETVARAATTSVVRITGLPIRARGSSFLKASCPARAKMAFWEPAAAMEEGM